MCGMFAITSCEYSIMLEQPWHAECQGGNHGDDLGDEGHGLILNLGESLEQTDQQAYGHANQQRRRH